MLFELREVLESSKFIRQIRKRPNGINAASLALGAKVSKADEMTMEVCFLLNYFQFFCTCDLSSSTWTETPIPFWK